MKNNDRSSYLSLGWFLSLWHIATRVELHVMHVETRIKFMIRLQCCDFLTNVPQKCVISMCSVMMYAMVQFMLQSITGVGYSLNSAFLYVISGPVTCLSLSLDGLTLASGSQDASVRLWNTASRQCIRTIHHTGMNGSVDLRLITGMMKALY